MEFILVILGTAALVWGLALFQRGGLLFLCVATLLVASIFGHPFMHFKAGPLPLTFDRLVAGCAVLAYLVYRRNGWADPKPLGKADIWLGLLIGGLTVSLFLGDFQSENYAPSTKLAFFWVMPAAIYWVTRQSNYSEHWAKLVAIYFGLFAIYLGITGFAETRELWFLVYPKYVAVKEGAFLGRARGPFLNPVSTAPFMCVAVAAAMLRWNRVDLRGRLAILAVVAISALGTYCTYTRMVWFSYGVVVVVVAGCLLPRNFRIPVAAVCLLLTSVLVATNFDRLVKFKRDKNATSEAARDSATIRPVFAAIAWRMFQENPIFGCGFGQYSAEKNFFLSDRNTPHDLERGRPYVQHNIFLALICECGLLATVPFVLLLCCWSWDAWQLWRDPLQLPHVRDAGMITLAALIAYVMNGMAHDVSIIPVANLLLFFLAGITTGLKMATVNGVTNPMLEWDQRRTRRAGSPLAIGN